MKRNFFYTSFAALLILSNTALLAQNNEVNLGEPILNSSGQWFITLGAGEQFPQWHNPMKVTNNSGFPGPYAQDLYTTKNQSEAVIALSLGRRWERNDFWIPAYSFAAVWKHFFKTHLGKTVTLNSAPEFTNYKYNWDLTANLLLASAKVNLFQYKKVSPYLNGGIGSSFNRTSNYKETALISGSSRVSPQFSNFSTSEFAYQLGLGIDLQLTSQFIVSAGYNYQDLGQISSGSGKEMWSDQSLNPGNYHSHEVLLSLSYLFDKTS